MKRPKAIVATLGQFVRAFDQSTKRESTERVLVIVWGPILLVLPRDRSGWK